MAEEPRKGEPEDLESILAGLDEILSAVGGVPQPEQPAAVEPPKPVSIEPPASVPVEIPEPIPVEPPKPVAVELPKPSPVEPPTPAVSPQIELAPRAGFIKPPETPPAPVKPEPVASAKLEPAPPAAKAAEPPPTPAAAAPEDLPPNAPKDQIRRVAYAHTAPCADVENAFASFLAQAARTISKKPLFLRAVLSHEVGASSDPNAVLEKARQAKAVALLAVVEDWPPAKVDELSEACSRAGLLFRSVPPADTQKKSMAVDIIVDMMLLAGES